MAVDDEKEIVQMIREALQSQGYMVETANSGKECLAKVGAFNPDMILLDIMMPGMDGWEVVEELTRMGIPDKAHIVMLTAKPLSEDDTRRDVFNSIVHYIRKPFNFPTLFKEIDRIVHEEKAVEEEAAKVSRSFGKQFAGAYKDYFKTASRQKRIFSHIVKEKIPGKGVIDTTRARGTPGEKEPARRAMESIERMEKELKELRRVLERLDRT